MSVSFILIYDSIIALTQIVTAVFMTWYIVRLKHKARATWWLALFFFGMTAMAVGFFLECSLMLWGDVFFSVQVLSTTIGLIGLIQFAYHVPSNDQPVEARRVLFLALAGLGVVGWAALTYIYSFVVAMPALLLVSLPLVSLTISYVASLIYLVGAIVVMLRRTIHLSWQARQPAQGATLPEMVRAIVRPATHDAAALRTFAVILAFGIIPSLSPLLYAVQLVDSHNAAYIAGLGILLVLVAVFLVYLAYAREPSSFIARIFSISLVFLLALFGIVTLITTSARNAQFKQKRQWQIALVQQAIAHNDLAHLPEEVAYIAAVPRAGDATYRPVYLREPQLDGNLQFIAAEEQLRDELGRSSLDLEGVRTVDYVRELVALPSQTGRLRYADHPPGTIPRYAGYQVSAAAGRYEVGFRVADDLRYSTRENFKLILLLLVSTLLLWLTLPVVFTTMLMRPLNALLNGVRRANEGDLDIAIPVYQEDEIGFLARAFNNMVGTLRKTTTRLEQRVAERTTDLTHTNTRLMQEIARREAIETALRESEEKYRSVSERANDGIAIVQDGAIRYCNGRLAEMLACTIDDIYDKPVAIFFVPDQRPTITERLERRMRGEDVPTRYETVLLRSDARHLDVEINASLMEYEQRQAVLAFVRDISERKRDEEAFQRSKARLQAIFDNAAVGIGVVDMSGHYIEVNDKWAAMLGYAADEVYQRVNVDVTHPDDREISRERLQALAQGEIASYRLEKRFIRKDGSIFWGDLSVTPICGEDGRVDSIIGIIADITERKQVEAALRQSEETYRLLAENMHDVIWTMDVEGNFTYVSPSVYYLRGYTAEEVLQQKMHEVLTSASLDVVLASVQQAQETGIFKVNRLELEQPCKDGSTVWTECVTTPLLDQHGTLTGWVGVSRDISERWRAAEELRQAKEAAEAANHAKSAFLANMSHELRTPLNAILGFAQVMNYSDGLTPEYREYVEIIHHSGEHLLSLINSVLDLSKIEAGHMAVSPDTFDLHHMLSGIESMFLGQAHDKNLRLAFDYAPDVPCYVHADEMKLRQVLINLLSNAIKFTEEGSVTLRVGGGQLLAGNGDGAHAPGFLLPTTGPWLLRFEVKDTGPGIVTDDLHNIFEAFVQVKTGKMAQGGTGLGLAISHRFVSLMGGELNVRSEPGHGTTFAFTVPVELVPNPQRQRSDETRHVVGLAPGQPCYRLLIVDDSHDARIFLTRLFVPLGFDLREACNGAEAIALWKAWSPHLIWMDMRMPVMGGKEATRHIKATPEGQHTLIIALTASAFEEERAEILAAGCNDFLRKPFRLSDIFAMMHKHLGVRYIYESDQPPSYTDHTAAGLPRYNSPEMLAALSNLPSDLLSNLEHAALRSDMEPINNLIAQVASHNASLSDILKRLANDFEYDKILALIEECKGRKP
jgi:PAS domain S-box-containing protein